MKNKYTKQKGGNPENKMVPSAPPMEEVIKSPIVAQNVKPFTDKKEPVIIGRIPYDIKIFSFLCILGLLIRILFSSNNEYATATIWGYGFSVLALFGLIVTSFAISSKNQMNQGVVGFFKVLLKNAGPIVLTISIISLILAQNISFYKIINSGKVAPQYYQFSGVSGFLILIQTSLVIKYLMDILKGNTSNSNTSEMMVALASELNSIILILTVANIGIIGILQVILQYFSTDG